jgi:GNAT superfamily N-acetyltransferase
MNYHQCTIALDLLATLPTHQRRGLARAHIKWGLDLADREGLLVFLESTPSGEKLYERLGFKEVSRATHDLEKWGGEGLYTHVFMVREPGAAQS